MSIGKYSPAGSLSVTGISNPTPGQVQISGATPANPATLIGTNAGYAPAIPLRIIYNGSPRVDFDGAGSFASYTNLFWVTTLANGIVAMVGNRDAADTNSDIILRSTATRTAGSLLHVANGNGNTRFGIGYAGKLEFTAGAGAAVAGAATLVAGTVTVNTTAIRTGDKVLFSLETVGGTPGFPRVSTITNATSFVITSTSGTDTSTYTWVILRAA